MATNTERTWQRIVETELARPRVVSGTGFGRNVGLRVSGKIYAFVSNENLVVKLPRGRVEELTAAGVGARFDPGHGRVMKEWIAFGPETARRWRGLVDEARAHVDPG